MNSKKGEALTLLVLVLLLSFAKLYFYLPIKSPSVMGDEACYIGLAHNFATRLSFYTDNFLSKACHYPGGYPLSLSIAFVPSPPTFYEAFSLIKFINALTSSLIIIPIYLILRELADNSRIHCLSFAIAISTIPSVLTYFFRIMSENLFTLIVLLNFYFLIKLTKRIDVKTLMIFGFLNFYAVFTREIGITVNIASLISLLVLLRENNLGFKRSLKSFSTWLFAYLIPTFLWLVYRAQTQERVSGYPTSKYMNALLNSGQLLFFLKLYFNEILYLFVATFVVFGILAFWKMSDLFKDRNKRPIVLFVSALLLLMLLITSTHQLSAFLNPNQSYDYSVLGRYLDPAIPILFILGTIKLLEHKLNLKIFIFFTSLVLTIIFLTFPISGKYKPGIISAIYYLKSAGMEFLIFVVIVFLLLSIFFSYGKAKKRHLVVFVLLIITTNIFTTSYSYAWYNEASMSHFTRNQEVIDVLKTLSKEPGSKQIVVYIDHPYWKYYYSMWGLPLHVSIVKDLSNKIREGKSFYLITGCILLDQNPLAQGSMHKVYYVKNASAIKYICFKNFHKPQHWGRWSIDNSSLILYVPKNSTVLLYFKLSSFYEPRKLKIFINDELVLDQEILTSPTEIRIQAKLKGGKNEIRLFTPDGCQRPVDLPGLRSKDERCLAFALRNISISELNPN